MFAPSAQKYYGWVNRARGCGSYLITSSMNRGKVNQPQVIPL